MLLAIVRRRSPARTRLKSFFCGRDSGRKKMPQSFRMYAEKKHFFAAAIAAAKKCKKQTRMNAEQRILNAEQRILNACSKVRFSITQVFYPGSCRT